MTGPRIHLRDICAAGYCVLGARDWFRSHGFDWRGFVRDGIPESDLLATGDALAQRVIERKQQVTHG